MKRILLLAALLSACATEPMETTDTGAAGSVAVDHEALLATCTDSAYCSKSRSTIASYLGGPWSWANSCSDSVWNATGPGGRTLQAFRISGTTLYQHSVWASQTANFQNICSCSNGNVSCSNNPGF